MEKIAVVLVDDDNDFRWVMNNFFTRNGILLSGSFTHNKFLKQNKLQDNVDIIIISFDTPQFLTELSIAFVRKHSMSVKILISSDFHNRRSIDKLRKMNIDGIVFKTEQDPEQILKALNALKEGGNFLME